ncbi:MAG: hypothetical protein LW860_09615 [Xanthomonadaceae bacterium]|nr:hypothetical protein [Xanthomonadaceae bacterium]
MALDAPTGVQREQAIAVAAGPQHVAGTTGDRVDRQRLPVGRAQRHALQRAERGVMAQQAGKIAADPQRAVGVRVQAAHEQRGTARIGRRRQGVLREAIAVVPHQSHRGAQPQETRAVLGQRGHDPRGQLVDPDRTEARRRIGRREGAGAGGEQQDQCERQPQEHPEVRSLEDDARKHTGRTGRCEPAASPRTRGVDHPVAAGGPRRPRPRADRRRISSRPARSRCAGCDRR